MGKGIARLMVHALPLGFRLDNQDSSSTAIVASFGGTLEVKRHSTVSGPGVGFGYDRFVVANSADQNRWSILVTWRFID
jgi:hypothetical protein